MSRAAGAAHSPVRRCFSLTQPSPFTVAFDVLPIASQWILNPTEYEDLGRRTGHTAMEPSLTPVVNKVIVFTDATKH